MTTGANSLEDTQRIALSTLPMCWRSRMGLFEQVRASEDLASLRSMGDFDVVVGTGTLQGTAPDVVRFPHQWTAEGVTVEAAFIGAHLLHLAAAGCVLNDIYREARPREIPIHGVRVAASGDFDPKTWKSTGIEYVVEVDSPASADELADLLDVVDAVAEIPKSIRAGASVERLPT
jgi:uncharacterized OsmC-like protein